MYKIVHYLIHKPDQDHSDIETSQNSLELPFSLMLEYEFKRRNIRVQVQEVNFDFLKDPVPAFLKKYGIEKDHFVCFDEMICKRFSPTFSKALIEMKNNVAALWIALGAKPVIGRFSMAAFTKSGFVCPEMKYPLRNPIDVAKKAYKVSQDGVKNLRELGLQNEVHLPDTNLVQGQVIEIEDVHPSYLDAVQAATEKIPKPMSALIFIDVSQIADFDPEKIHTAFVERKQPILIRRSQEFSLVNAQKWLCEPQTRKTDLCIIGKNHRSNGIQTEIVIHVLPESCPDCKHSDEDPVVASRATAMFIYAHYQRLDCPNCLYEPDPETKATFNREMSTDEFAANIMLEFEETSGADGSKELTKMQTVKKFETKMIDANTATEISEPKANPESNVSLTEEALEELDEKPQTNLDTKVDTQETKPDETQSKTNSGCMKAPELSEEEEKSVAEKLESDFCLLESDAAVEENSKSEHEVSDKSSDVKNGKKQSEQDKVPTGNESYKFLHLLSHCVVSR